MGRSWEAGEILPPHCWRSPIRNLHLPYHILPIGGPLTFQVHTSQGSSSAKSTQMFCGAWADPTPSPLPQNLPHSHSSWVGLEPTRWDQYLLLPRTGLLLRPPHPTSAPALWPAGNGDLGGPARAPRFMCTPECKVRSSPGDLKERSRRRWQLLCPKWAHGFSDDYIYSAGEGSGRNKGGHVPKRTSNSFQPIPGSQKQFLWLETCCLSSGGLLPLLTATDVTTERSRHAWTLQDWWEQPLWTDETPVGVLSTEETTWRMWWPGGEMQTFTDLYYPYW